MYEYKNIDSLLFRTYHIDTTLAYTTLNTKLLLVCTSHTTNCHRAMVINGHYEEKMTRRPNNSPLLNKELPPFSQASIVVFFFES